MYKNILKLLSGNIIAQAIVFLSIPFITRLYNPEIYGIYSVIVSITLVIIPLTTLRFETAILAKEKKKSYSFFYTAIIFSLFFSISLYFIWDILERNIGKDISVGDNLFYFCLIVFFNALFILSSSLINKEKMYQFLSLSKVIQSSCLIGVQILLGYIAPNIKALIVSLIISYIVASIFILFKLRKSLKIAKNKPKLSNFIDAKNYIVYSTPSSILNAISQNVYVLILLSLYGPFVSGIYALSNRLILAPSALIGKSTRDVFIQEASSLENNRTELKKLYYKTTKKLFLIAIPIYSFAALLAPVVFPLFLGSEWNEVGILFSILTLWGVSLFCNAPSLATANVINIQKESLIYEIVYLIIRILTVYFLFFIGLNYIFVTVGFSIVSFVMNLGFIIYVYKKI